jgi:hypothetical protein
MSPTKEHREMHPIAVPSALKIIRKDGTRICIRALGTAYLTPAIDFTCETTLPSGRTRTDLISLIDDEFSQVLEYLEMIKKHWEQE